MDANELMECLTLALVKYAPVYTDDGCAVIGMHYDGSKVILHTRTEKAALQEEVLHAEW